MLTYFDFARKPFQVEAVEVTLANIHEIATFVGEVRYKDDDESAPYIYVDRRLVPNIYRVYPGFYMTRMGDNIRCYSRRVFLEQFVPVDNVSRHSVEFLNGLSSLEQSTLD